MEVKQLSAEEILLYDRQRFIGIEIQKRLINSTAILINLEGSICELAKNLILTGVNVVLIDNSFINDMDVQQNFLIGDQDLNQNKGQIIQKRLQGMNPLVSIQLFQKFNCLSDLFNNQEFQKYCDNASILALGSHLYIQIWNEFSREKNLPFYAIIQAGFYGAILCDLGNNFTFTKYNFIQSQKNQENQIISCLELKQTFECQKRPNKNNLVFYGLKKLELNPNLSTELLIEKYIDKIRNKELFIKFVNQFQKCFGIEYIPTYSILGSIASQEFIKVIGSKIFKIGNLQPECGWFCYDSQEGYGIFETII